MLEFDPLVTTLVGRNDVGKSAALRLLKWVCLNQPQGEAFITQGEDKALGKLWVEERVVTRSKGGGENLYKIGDKLLPPLGMGVVPEEISNFLNVGEVNFQGQHDPLFWFTDTAGQVSRNLNQIINLSLIDESLAAVASELREARTVERVCKEREKSAKQELDSLSWVPEFGRRLGEVEGTFRKLEAYQRGTEELAVIVGRLDEATQTKRQAGKAAQAGEKLLARVDRLLKSRKKSDKLESIIIGMETTGLVATLKLPDLGRVSAEFSAADAFAEQNRELDRLITAATRVEEELCQTRQTLAETVKEMEEKTSGRCPLCGTATASLPSSSATSTSPTSRRLRVPRS